MVPRPGSRPSPSRSSPADRPRGSRSPCRRCRPTAVRSRAPSCARTRSALTPEAVAIAALVREDTGTLIAREVIPDITTEPIPFTIAYPDVIDPDATYIVRAAIIDGASRWGSPAGVPAIEGGSPVGPVTVEVVKASTPTPTPAPTAKPTPKPTAKPTPKPTPDADRRADAGADREAHAEADRRADARADGQADAGADGRAHGRADRRADRRADCRAHGQPCRPPRRRPPRRRRRPARRRPQARRPRRRRTRGSSRGR